MKRCYSLKKNKEFSFTYRQGRACSGRLFTLIYVKSRPPRRRKHAAPAPRVPQAPVHIGLSVSKKIGNSVVRNRVKRRLRAAVTPFIPQIKPGFNLIVVARPTLIDEPFPNIEHAMRALLKKADLLRPGAGGRETE